MRELQVLPATVNVEMRSQQFGAHRRALDMPARTPVAPRRLPEGLALLSALPQDEIERIALGGIDLDPLPGTQIFERFPRELAVTWKLPDREVHVAAFRAIGDAPLLQSPDQLQHLVDVVRCARLDIGRLRCEQRRVFVRISYKAFGQSRNGLTSLRRAADDLVVDIGNIAHISQRIAACTQPALYYVEHDHHSRMPEMAEVVRRDPAHVHPHPRRIEGNERFLPAAEAVVEFQHGLETDSAASLADPAARGLQLIATQQISDFRRGSL